MATPRRRRHPKKKKRPPAPPRRERTKRGRTRATTLASPPKQDVLIFEAPLQLSESLYPPEVKRRKGRPPGGTHAEAWAEHLRRHPLDELGEDGKPLKAASRKRYLFDEQGISVSDRTVRRWRDAAPRR